MSDEKMVSTKGTEVDPKWRTKEAPASGPAVSPTDAALDTFPDGLIARLREQKCLGSTFMTSYLMAEAATALSDGAAARKKAIDAFADGLKERLRSDRGYRAITTYADGDGSMIIDRELLLKEIDAFVAEFKAKR